MIDPREQIVKRIEELHAQAQVRIFSLATGALALSITFRRSLIPDDPTHLWALKASWLAFLISILSYVIGLVSEGCVWAVVLENPDCKLNTTRRATIVATSPSKLPAIIRKTLAAANKLVPHLAWTLDMD